MLTRDELIRMAAESGALRYTNRHIKDEPSHAFAIGMLERFAAAVYAAGAAAEREACAQACESTAWTATIPEWREMTKKDIAARSMTACAIAIRQRSTDPRAPGCAQPGAGRQAPCRCGPDGCADSACPGRSA